MITVYGLFCGNITVFDVRKPLLPLRYETLSEFHCQVYAKTASPISTKHTSFGFISLWQFNLKVKIPDSFLTDIFHLLVQTSQGVLHSLDAFCILICESASKHLKECLHGIAITRNALHGKSRGYPNQAGKQ